jgi:hypothetical protein
MTRNRITNTNVGVVGYCDGAKTRYANKKLVNIVPPSTAGTTANDCCSEYFVHKNLSFVKISEMVEQRCK